MPFARPNGDIGDLDRQSPIGFGPEPAQDADPSGEPLSPSHDERVRFGARYDRLQV